MIWKQDFNLEGMNKLRANTLLETLGIEFTDFGPDYITGTMPVDDRTVQPMRLLHGGATAALAETLGSFASLLAMDDIENYQSVGTELNISHLRAATSGKVTGTARPIRIGRRIHVWEIRIENEAGKLVSISRLTVNVIPASP